MKRMRLAAVALVGMASALSMTSANALTVSFYNGSNLFATLSTSGGTTFSLLFNGQGTVAGAYIDYIDMAGPGGTFTNTSSAAVTTASVGIYSAAGFTDAGSTYNWQIEFPNPNTFARLTIGETATWSIVVTDPNAWNFNLLHVNAFDAQGRSIKLLSCIDCTPQVPEPGTLALFSLGLLGLGLSRRIRR